LSISEKLHTGKVEAKFLAFSGIDLLYCNIHFVEEKAKEWRGKCWEVGGPSLRVIERRVRYLLFDLYQYDI
jgi:hypothetical protein